MTAVAGLVVGVGAAAAANVEPPTVTQTLASGTSTTITKTVHTPAIPPKVDILFLADTTGSMGGAIGNVQANASSILSSVRADQPDSQFGAAEYRDFNCTDPFAYRLDQAITANLTDAQNGINAWATGNGCDTPEAQINALFTLATDPATAFRAGSDRVVVWFGDSNGHDPSGGHSLADAIAALQAADITVIAIPVSTGSGNGLDTGGQASAVASATGGQVLPSATPEEVSDAILSGLTNLPVTVTPVPTCDTGLSATYDAPSKTVTSGDDATFLETLTVAPDAPDGGTLHCTVDFLLNGQHVDGFQEEVAIDVPLRSTDLALVKSASPSSVTEGGNVTFTLTATNNGTDPDTNVSASDPLPAGESFVSGDPGCSAAASVVTCDFGTLAAGASASKSFVVHVANGAASTLTNTATVTGDRPESNTGDNSSTVTVNVNHNPVCTGASAGPNLWPPNHKFVWSSVSGVTDSDGNPVAVTITGIRQDEPTNGLGDGDTAVDGQIGTGNSFAVRAERSGTGDGRVYHVFFSASDGNGGSCTGSALIGVPHDQGNGSTPIDGGALYDSTV